MSNLQCTGCGVPVGTGAIPLALRCACCDSIEIRKTTHGVLCNSRCREQTARRTVARHSRCHHCGDNFDNEHIRPDGTSGPGRPRTYCTDECRDAAKHLRDKAAIELAKETYRYRTLDDWQAALFRAENLFEFWAGHGPTKPLETPEPEARQALRDRIHSLRQGRDNAAAEAWQERQRDLDAKRREGWQARREREAKRAKEWRDHLASGAGP